MPKQKNDDAPWMLGWIAVGACLSAKESVRLTALWHFDVKPLFLVATIGLLYLALSMVILAIARKRSIALYRSGTLVGLTALVQMAGMVVHTLASFGFALPESALFLSALGMEASLPLLLIASQHLYSFGGQRAQTGFIYSMFFAGVLWILLVFLDASISRLVVSALCPAAAVMIWRSLARRTADNAAFSTQPDFLPKARSGKKRDSDSASRRAGKAVCGQVTHGQKTGSPKQPKSAQRPEEAARREQCDFRRSMLVIFLVSLVIMGVYSRWQGQQDGGIASVLIQICSALGLVSAAAFSMIAHKRLKAPSLFLICQTIVLPVAIGALYLGTIFEGPGVSVSVLLFDLAYGLILLSIWLAPYAYTTPNTLFVLTAGFLSHKMGWAVGLSLTWAFPWPDLQWIGTLVIIAAFLALIALSGATIVRNRHDTDEALSAGPEYGHETACRIVGERYGLTKRENEILLLLAKGRTAPYLARDLFISESTARTHISHIYRKMEINSQQELLDEIECTLKAAIRERRGEQGNTDAPQAKLTP